MKNLSRPLRTHLRILAVSLATLIVPTTWAQTLAAPFATDYTITSLGSIAGLPAPYGGLTLLAGSTDTLLIGGSANTPSGDIYSIGITRDLGGHITGFSGTATFFAEAPYIDGGLAYGPNGVLFFTGYPVNTLGQLKSGSTVPDKTTNLTALGVSGSVGSLVFAPNGDLKLLSYSANAWYTSSITQDGSGTFDVGSAVFNTTIIGGPEGAAYVPTGSAVFTSGSVLIAEWGAGNVSTYETDANYNPIAGTRQVFISGLSGAEGAFIDPVTGDFLFSTFGGGNQVIRVSGGFVAPPPPPPPGVPDESSVLGLMGIALAALVALRRVRRA